MLPKLNYYSRYHRTKNPADIVSLYNLIAGLNLDVIVSQDMSFTLPTPIEERTGLRRGLHNDGDKSIKQSSHHRRHMSCHSRSIPDNINIHAMKQQRFIEYNEQKSNEEQQKQQESVSNIEEQQYRKSNSRKIMVLNKVINDAGLEIRSGTNSRTLEAMDCLIETESIHSVGNKSDQCPYSPKMVRVAKNPSTENENLQKDSINKKYSSIESLDIKKCSSHDSADRKFEDQNSENLAVHANSQQFHDHLQDPLGASSHDHREEDIYSEEFIDDITKLVRNSNEADRKSTKEAANNMQDHDLQHSKSELLERVRGSDIEFEDIDYFEYPSTSKKAENRGVPGHQDEDDSEIEFMEFQDQQNNYIQQQGEEQEQEQVQEEQEYEQQEKEEEEDIQEYQQQNQKQDLNERYYEQMRSSNNEGSPISNLQQVKETMSEEEDHQQVQHSAVLERLNFCDIAKEIPKQDIENIYVQEHPSEQASPSTNRKSFKKVIRKQAQPVQESPQIQNVPKAQNSPVNFKRTRQLNPRLVTSTILPEGKTIQSPASTISKKVNFKKALMRGQQNRQKPDSSKISLKGSSPQKSQQKRVEKKEQSKKLLQAFFEQN